MSFRPRESFEGRLVVAGQRMAPGGRRWSEAPIPRPARRRVRTMGPPPVCAGYNLARDTFTTGGATFHTREPFIYVALEVIVDVSITHTGVVGFRVRQEGGTWSAYTNRTGPGAFSIHLFPPFTNGSPLDGAVDVEWNVSGAVNGCCVQAISAE